MNYKPAVNFIQDSLHSGSVVVVFEVFRHPINKVVFKDTLDDLME